MWVIIRLTLAAIGFVTRLPWRRRIGTPTGEHHGIPYFVRIKKGGLWGKYIYEHRVGMPLQAPTWIRMTRETRFDRFCKRIGIANEEITGDAKFDDEVYVTCDHPYVGALLTASPTLRAAVLAGFREGYTVHYDGSFVWLADEWLEEVPPLDPKLLDALDAIRRASAPLQDDIPSRFRDRFLWRAFVIEGVIWAIAAYAYGAYVGFFATRKEFVHVSLLLIIVVGIGFAIVLFALLVALILMFMRGSSRGHRVVAESVIVLACSLPIAGWQLAHDTNRHFDSGPSIVRGGVAIRCERKAAKGGPLYFMYMERVEAPVPDKVRVAQPICDSVRGDTYVRFTIGGGYWGLPWYRKIETPTATWTPAS